MRRHCLERPAVDLWPDELEPLVVEAYISSGRYGEIWGDIRLKLQPLVFEAYRCGSGCGAPHRTVLDRLEERVVEAYR